MLGDSHVSNQAGPTGSIPSFLEIQCESDQHQGWLHNQNTLVALQLIIVGFGNETLDDRVQALARLLPAFFFYRYRYFSVQTIGTVDRLLSFPFMTLVALVFSVAYGHCSAVLDACWYTAIRHWPRARMHTLNSPTTNIIILYGILSHGDRSWQCLAVQPAQILYLTCHLISSHCTTAIRFSSFTKHTLSLEPTFTCSCRGRKDKQAKHIGAEVACDELVHDTTQQRESASISRLGPPSFAWQLHEQYGGAAAWIHSESRFKRGPEYQGSRFHPYVIKRLPVKQQLSGRTHK